MWTDHFDGKITDIFEFQDTIARRIAGTLAANVTLIESRRQLHHPRPNPTAFDLVLRARAIGQGGSRTTNRQFRELITKAIELDPNYAVARALLAEALYSMAILGWTEFPDQELARGAAEARKAIALGPNDPDGYRALGHILLARTEYDQAKDVVKRAIEINPSDANALAIWGSVQSFSGDIGGATSRSNSPSSSIQCSNRNSCSIWRSPIISRIATRTRSASPSVALRVIPIFPCSMSRLLAAAAQLGCKEQAARYIETLRRRVPFLDLDKLGSRFKDPSHPEYLREGLKAAGL